MKILDTHGGSFNSAMSAYYFGFIEFVGIEKNKRIFNKSIKNFNQKTLSQLIDFNWC